MTDIVKRLRNLSIPMDVTEEAADEIERLRGKIDRWRLKKRPVMFRVMDDNVWKVFGGEKEASEYADKIGSSYQGLYVRDGSQ